MDRTSIALFNPVQAHKVLADLWMRIKAETFAGNRLVIEVKDETRRTAQNNLLHSSLADIAKQVEWHGKKLHIDVWKRLCTAAWLREEGASVEMIPALDGKGFDIVYAPTSKLTVRECASLTDWIHAFGDEHGVVWSPTSLGQEWSEYA